MSNGKGDDWMEQEDAFFGGSGNSRNNSRSSNSVGDGNNDEALARELQAFFNSGEASSMHSSTTQPAAVAGASSNATSSTTAGTANNDAVLAQELQAFFNGAGDSSGNSGTTQPAAAASASTSTSSSSRAETSNDEILARELQSFFQSGEGRNSNTGGGRNVTPTKRPSEDNGARQKASGVSGRKTAIMQRQLQSFFSSQAEDGKQAVGTTERNKEDTSSDAVLAKELDAFFNSSGGSSRNRFSGGGSLLPSKETLDELKKKQQEEEEAEQRKAEYLKWKKRREEREDERTARRMELMQRRDRQAAAMGPFNFRNMHSGMPCAICSEAIPASPDGRVYFKNHPYFHNLRACPDHDVADFTRACASCQRWEPLFGEAFSDLGDGDRCVCGSCERSVVVDNAELKPLWDKVLDFFKDTLNLTVWEAMRNIPVLAVGHDALNSQSQGTAHGNGHTRGLCMCEMHIGRRIPLPSFGFGAMPGAPTYYDVPSSSNVTAVLCLYGMPAELTTSVLAHEALHAWFKLHPEFDVASEPMPPEVEEGCCNLIAYLYLTKGEKKEPITEEEVRARARDQADRSNDDEDGNGELTDDKLTDYFQFQLATNKDLAYGGGFRTAWKAYSKIGLDALLQHVLTYRSFPDV